MIGSPQQIKETLDELKCFPFFRAFPDDLLVKVASLVETATFAPGTPLLKQGETNDRLYFLRTGTVVVLVDGEIVSQLASPGDILGEMSLISRKPVGASVQAMTTVDAFTVSEASLADIPEDERKIFEALLFRLYATILADRLTQTNEKAKRFESVNRDLQSAHAELGRINANLESEIARRSEELVQKVRSLTITHLQPAQELLSKSTLNQEGATATLPAQDIMSLRHSVHEVIEFLQPVAELGARNGGPSQRRVLLCDANRKQISIARLALGGTGVQLSIATTLEELQSRLDNENFDLILCDAEVQQAAKLISEQKPQIPLALLVNLDIQFYLETLRAMPSTKYFVSRDLNNRTFTIKNIAATVTKILNKDLFGMEKYLSWGSRIIEKTVSDSTQRKELIEEMEAHLSSIGLRSALTDRVRIVTEELLMNAIYDAPVGADGKSLYNHLPRTERVQLSPEHQGKLRYGTDGVFVGISMSDPFGHLSKGVIIDYLARNYAGESLPASAGKGGAGRGLHLIIESSDLTIFNVKAGQRTEVLCLFNLETNKEAESQPTFHLFMS